MRPATSGSRDFDQNPFCVRAEVRTKKADLLSTELRVVLDLFGKVRRDHFRGEHVAFLAGTGFDEMNIRLALWVPVQSEERN